MSALQEINSAVESLFKVGDRVRRRHAWDGSSKAGAPSGPLLTVTRVFPGQPLPIYQLLDGRTEFEFNLSPEAVESQWLRDAKTERLAS